MVPAREIKIGWSLPAGLVALGAIPVVAGLVRLGGLASGAPITPQNARFFAEPVPVVLHLVSAILFAVLGAFQFAHGLRRRRPSWHRRAGRYLIGCGLVAALSGLWMTAFYPPVEGDGPFLTGIRFLFGSAMLSSILLSVAAIRRRDMLQHAAWMTRAYAIGLGAGTQALVHLPFLFLGKPGVLGRALLMGAGWAINLAVAEWRIRRRSPVSLGIVRPSPVHLSSRH